MEQFKFQGIIKINRTINMQLVKLRGIPIEANSLTESSGKEIIKESLAKTTVIPG